MQCQMGYGNQTFLWEKLCAQLENLDMDFMLAGFKLDGHTQIAWSM